MSRVYLFLCACACLSVQFVQCIHGVCVCGQAEQHTSSFNDGLANGTCTLDKDEWCSRLVETAAWRSPSLFLKSTVSKLEHLGSIGASEAESRAIGAKSLIFLSWLLTMINAWTLGPLGVIMGPKSSGSSCSAKCGVCRHACMHKHTPTVKKMYNVGGLFNSPKMVCAFPGHTHRFFPPFYQKLILYCLNLSCLCMSFPPKILP